MRRLIVLGVSVASLVGFAAAPAPAQTFARECLVSGTAHYTPGVNPGTLDWTITGDGACGNQRLPIGPVETVHIGGVGTSNGFFDCGQSGTIGFGPDQVFGVNATYTDTTAPFTVTNEAQSWTAPLVMPLVTPFLAQTSGGAIGAGAFSTHIFFQCGNDARKPSAVYTWALVYPG